MRTMRNGSLAVGCICMAVVICAAPDAQAGWSCSGGVCTYTGSGFSDVLIVGCADDADADTTPELVVCDNGTLVQAPGYDDDCILGDDIDVVGGGGDDNMRIQILAATVSCSGTNITFSTLSGGGNADVDLIGGTGSDTLHGGGWDNAWDNDLTGQGGSDDLFGYSNGLGFNDGGSEGDVIITFGGTSSNEDLNGGTGSDCLEDVSGDADLFDCGSTEVDNWVNNLTGEMCSVAENDVAVPSC